MAFLNIKQLGFRQGAWALSLDLEIEQHALLVVIGASGAGKSTLLSLIGGFETPDSGRIILDDVDITRLAPSARPVTTLFQNHNLFAHLSLRDNIALACNPGLKLTSRDHQRVDEAIARVGLENVERQRPGEVSGGQAQRAALARCLCQERPLLLLHEPFTGLDPARRAEMRALVNRLRKERGLTVVLVSHNPQETLDIAGDALFLHHGTVNAKGPLTRLLTSTITPELSNYLNHSPEDSSAD